MLDGRLSPKVHNQGFPQSHRSRSAKTMQSFSKRNCLTWLFSQLSWFSTWKLVVSRITRDTLARSSSRTKYILKPTAFYKFRWIVVTWIGPSQAALLLPACRPNRSGGTRGRARQTLTSSLVFLLGKVKIMFLSDKHKRKNHNCGKFDAVYSFFVMANDYFVDRNRKLEKCKKNVTHWSLVITTSCDKTFFIPSSLRLQRKDWKMVWKVFFCFQARFLHLHRLCLCVVGESDQKMRISRIFVEGNNFRNLLIDRVTLLHLFLIFHWRLLDVDFGFGFYRVFKENFLWFPVILKPADNVAWRPVGLFRSSCQSEGKQPDEDHGGQDVLQLHVQQVHLLEPAHFLRGKSHVHLRRGSGCQRFDIRLACHQSSTVNYLLTIYKTYLLWCHLLYTNSLQL